MRTGYNALKVVVETSAGKRVNEPALALVTGLAFDTLYPGGLYGSCELFMPFVVSNDTPIREGQTVKVYNKLHLVWEGILTGIAYVLEPEAQGLQITCTGAWGKWMTTRRWNKRWADTRNGEEVWHDYINKTYGVPDKRTIEHEDDGGIQIVPKNVAWLLNEGAAAYYTMPTGETVKRVKFGYALSEGAQNWNLELTSGGAALWSVSTSGTGNVDHTLATPAQTVYFIFRANANQTPLADGTHYGEWINIVVYSELGNINAYEIAVDVAGHVTELSADTSLISSSMTYDLTPFISENDALSDIIANAASFGTPTSGAIGYGIRGSDKSSDGKPILFLESWPALTDYDYVLRLGETNIEGGVQFEKDINSVVNWVTVKYTNKLGQEVWITPDDDAALKDTASIAAYGEMHGDGPLEIETNSAVVAKAWGVRYLAQKKDPQWICSGGITVKGSIRGKSGEIIPASQIEAGKRIKIENWLNDVSGTGMTHLITGTSYTDAEETCQMDLGETDNMAVMWARMDAKRKY